MSNYLIATEGEYCLYFFYKILGETAITTRIAPTEYPNRKKARRVLRRLKKHHGNDWFLVRQEDLER